jgi:hypothetical protein
MMGPPLRGYRGAGATPLPCGSRAASFSGAGRRSIDRDRRTERSYDDYRYEVRREARLEEGRRDEEARDEADREAGRHAGEAARLRVGPAVARPGRGRRGVEVDDAGAAADPPGDSPVPRERTPKAETKSAAKKASAKGTKKAPAKKPTAKAATGTKRVVRRSASKGA